MNCEWDNSALKEVNSGKTWENVAWAGDPQKHDIGGNEGSEAARRTSEGEKSDFRWEKPGLKRMLRQWNQVIVWFVLTCCSKRLMCWKLGPQMTGPWGLWLHQWINPLMDSYFDGTIGGDRSFWRSGLVEGSRLLEALSYLSSPFGSWLPGGDQWFSPTHSPPWSSAPSQAQNNGGSWPWTETWNSKSSLTWTFSSICHSDVTLTNTGSEKLRLVDSGVRFWQAVHAWSRDL
jgi:hypothetical protein